jgi:hypothetical protein
MRIHGHTAGKKLSPTFISWLAMRIRCKNPKCNDYDRYGGAGITVCKRWKRFENFLADMGERPVGMVLDRKKNNRNYEPSNCRWVTWVDSANNRRNTAFVLFNGKRLPVAEVERILGFSKGTVRHRAKEGIDVATLHWGNSRPGVLNPSSKCTEEMVRKIRASIGPDRIIGKTFGLSKYCVWAIRKRKTYKNVL